MNKLFITLIVAFVCTNASAQKALQATKNLFGGFKYELLVGYNTTNATEPFDEAKVGTINLGATARKDITTFKDDKIAINGIVGITYTRRGGKTDNDFMTLLDDTKNWMFSALSVPIHIGSEYRFKKFSIFADLGPNLLFNLGGDEIENLSNKGFGVGGGFNLGVRFKKFALSFGFDTDLTTMGTFTPDSDQKGTFNLEKDKYNLKTGEFHFYLRWTL